MGQVYQINKNNVKLNITNEFVKKLSESNSLNEEEDLYFRYYSDMIGSTCIYPEYEDYLIKNKIRYEKCYSKKSKRLWLKVHPMDESNHWDFFHSIDTYVKFVLDD